MRISYVIALSILWFACPTGADDLFFEDKIERIFASKCFACHNQDDSEAELDLSSPESILSGSENGKVLSDAEPERSILLKRINAKQMPPRDAEQLSDDEIRSINQWVKQGAKFKSTNHAKVTAERIIPLLHLRCVKCHGASKQEGGLDLRSVESLLKGGKNGPVVVKGDSSKSLIVERIVAEEMPPRKRIVPDSVKTMTQAELRLLQSWIDQGMEPSPPYRYIRKTRNSDLDFWSFKPPRKIKTPAPSDHVVGNNPIDPFLLKRLESKGLHFSPEADSRTLIRRVYFDLTGLPPSPDEVKEYLNDNDPSAFEKLVDRLLLSPEFGEKWAAHWLDAVGYADSEGGQNEDRIRANMWHYRDYVVQAFSHDKPFDEFMIEQLAGDELYDYENQKIQITEEIYGALVATGYLRTTPDRTFQNITNFVPDRLDVIADELQVLGSSLLGLTINCARCHDHKFDPIPQHDYYRLAAVFKDALDEHDWLKPENRTMKIPVKRLAKDIPGYVRNSAREDHIQIRALWSRGRPSPSFLLLRGNPLTPGPLIRPYAPEYSLVSKSNPELDIQTVQHQTKKSGRRLAFAKWVTDERNPLTARVYVNRVWKSIFGKGIVSSLDNFGKTGATPTHPELLDWLAVNFIENDWSTKYLVRQMVTSRAYRQSSKVSTKSKQVDPDNRLLSRMPLKRLSAETVRDSILKVTQQLSSEKSGPPRPIKELGNGLVLSKELDSGGWTRSIYVIHRRSRIPTLMESFDYPQMGPNCISRKQSIVPQQALHLTNNELVHSWCDRWAGRLVEKIGNANNNATNNLRALVQHIVESAIGVSPTPEELDDFESYLNELCGSWKSGKSREPEDRLILQKALGTFCHTLINSASFIYVD